MNYKSSLKNQIMVKWLVAMPSPCQESLWPQVGCKRKMRSEGQSPSHWQTKRNAKIQAKLYLKSLLRLYVNILPTSMLRKLFKTKSDLIATNVSVSGFTGGATKTKVVIPIEIKAGSKVATVAFFVVNTDLAYNALLGRDWIHSNWVVSSSLQ